MTIFGKTIIGVLYPRVVDTTASQPKNAFDAVYILGGNQNSLILKFNIAYELCTKKGCNKILMLSLPGITEYSEPMGRNLTNDEWALMRLEKSGAPVDNIEFIEIEDAFFGTYNEAKNVSRIISEKSYASVALISSTYHTKRVRLSFEQFLKDRHVKLYVYGSREKGSAIDLMVEFAKLKLYQLLLV